MPDQTPQTAPPVVTQTPYGHQRPSMPMPAFDPRAGTKRPGETVCKVWGIILLVLGLIGIANELMGVAMMFGGFSGANFAPTLSEDAKAEMDRYTKDMITASLSRPTFWISAGAELVIVLLSLTAGFFLVIRPRLAGAKLALARAACVLLFLPAYGYEQIKALETTSEMQVRTMEIDAKARGGNPMPKDFTETFGKIMSGVTFGVVFVVIAGILVINALLAYQMSRPTVKAYLSSARSQQPMIPGYDPSMGLLTMPGAPPPPTPDGQPPGAVPPGRG